MECRRFQSMVRMQIPIGRPPSDSPVNGGRPEAELRNTMRCRLLQWIVFARSELLERTSTTIWLLIHLSSSVQAVWLASSAGYLREGFRSLAVHNISMDSRFVKSFCVIYKNSL